MTFVLLFAAFAAALQPPTCATAVECRQLTRAAIASNQFELAHDLAWLAYQKGPRSDPETLTLLARAQSLSGRGDDAFVMLRRLAYAGVLVEDVETSDDFARVRTDARWPDLLAAFTRLRAATVAAVASPGPAAPGTTPKAASDPLPAEAAPAEIAPKNEAVAPKAEAAPEPHAADATLAGEDLAVAGLSFTPAAMAYDAVSARFVLSTSSSDALTVLSQTSTNATALTSRGWSGLDRTTALAIDRASGDLWVAVRGSTGAALHRLQLISGRRLDAIELPEDAAAELVSIAATRGELFALDRANRRILRRGTQAEVLETFAALPKDLAASALAVGSSAIYVAHVDGVIRIDLGTRRQRALAVRGATPLSGLEAIEWHGGLLIGIQRTVAGLRVVRAVLDRAGAAVTRVETLGPAASAVSTLANGIFYYLTDDQAGRRIVRGIAVK